MIIAATGHRPDKLGGYGVETDRKLLAVARRYLEFVQPNKIISGMALGWDMAWAEAAIETAIPFIAAIPFVGQESRWPEPSQLRFRQLIRHACDVVVVCQGGYAASKMQRRNMWMTDKADRIAALWNGSPGGTANCVEYAQLCKKPIDNLWPYWAGEKTL